MDTPLTRYGVSKSTEEWAQEIPLTYQREFTNRQGKPCFIYMGFLPVHYKDIRRQMYLIVVHCSWYKKPMYLLTTMNPQMKGNFKRIRQIYCLRWGVEDAGRFIKQCFGVEDVRVRNLFAIKRLCLLCILAFWLLELVRNGGGALLKRILALARTLDEKKQVKFLYYRILKGLQEYWSGFS